jgi:tRNA U34 5-methylaminomethyl-2-thiouridine-forming methyltransferase MnmC
VTIFDLQPTDDGSFTFFSAEFGQAFHSSYGARSEALDKYVAGTQLSQRTHRSPLRILDICYGLGYNSAAALAEIWRVNPSCQVEIIALEISPQVSQAAIDRGLMEQWPEPIPQLLTELVIRGQVQDQRLRARLEWGDARQTIQLVRNSFAGANGDQEFLADAIFLDPFSPRSCPQLWTIEFLALVAACCAPDSLLATYSCAAAVRTALQATGLVIADLPAVGRKSPGTVASWNPQLLPALPRVAQEHLLTKAAVPYRDPQLQDSINTIIQRREQEQLLSPLASSAQWKKRWFEQGNQDIY